MHVEYEDFSTPQKSLFLTLTGRALDSRLPRPFLGDGMADEIVKETGFDTSIFRILSTDLRDPKNKVFEIAVRAKRMDEIVRRFVGRHPNAVVLDLGAGLDGRIHRVGVPDEVDWYDVDLPEVLSLRHRLLPPASSHSISADLRTDHGWLDEIAANRPVVVVADGLIPFLAQDELTSLLRRLTRTFPAGEIAFNGYTPIAVWALKHLRIAGSVDTDALLNPGFFDPRVPELWGAGLRLIEGIAIARAPEVDQLPSSVRLMHRWAGRSRIVSRFVATTVLHYSFNVN